MKYYKHMETRLDLSTGEPVAVFLFYQPEGGEVTAISIPEDPDNMDYARMMEEVEAGTSTIEEIDDTPE
jgi:hypothetical protein